MTPLPDAAAVGRARGVLTAVDAATLAALTVNGILCAILAVLFLPQYIGSTQVPLSALAAGAANVVLMRAAGRVAATAVGGALPLIGFALGFVLCTFGGPGGDSLIVPDWRTLLLVVGGMGPPAAMLVTARIRALQELTRPQA